MLGKQITLKDAGESLQTAGGESCLQLRLCRIASPLWWKLRHRVNPLLMLLTGSVPDQTLLGYSFFCL